MTADAAVDARHMAHALALARRGLGRTWPNPAVGCVLVKDGRVLGRGWTQPGGRPHAETEALAQAGPAARGATAYVSLEPCAHDGKTPPCADALIAAGIARLVAATIDPDPRTAGAGLAKIRAAGVWVDLGVLEAPARALNEGFFRRVADNRPMVTAKIATTLDGKIATLHGVSKWITGPAARRRAHLMRAQHDAVLAGIGTVLADDPLLNVRIDGLDHRTPVRIVLDRLGRTSAKSRLVQTAGTSPVWVISEKRQDLGPVEQILVPDIRDLKAILAELARRGLTRLLVEGGAQALASFFKQDLVDRIAWFRAASLIGGDGLPAVAALWVEQIDQLLRFRPVSSEAVGRDRLDLYVRAA
ncbi:MAG: bifunctional diaminohydroxyphosphoribosylaminopyrimidine deaminase/5-amino-6-(5-phosphoribosylamino)uracil reductase RibD [Rhodothalassiaceae bacterium]